MTINITINKTLSIQDFVKKLFMSKEYQYFQYFKIHTGMTDKKCRGKSIF